ncbi:cytochrome b-c1 complex subunit 2, mitochondrial-like [Oscarella lobularis]|uniref:cytochrome b-c1 complex subunit 2, mitochondrial-like n=1 Tax=Oscarella lobularis TaxID=121494 RepID=UPI0033141AB3
MAFSIFPRFQALQWTLGRSAYRAFAAAVGVPMSDPIPDTPSSEPFAKPPSEGVKISKLDNGFTVTSLETHSPVAKVALLVKAGSRYEAAESLGVTHHLRATAFMATKDRTAFRVSREIDHLGGNLSASSTRDHFIYSAECLREYVEPVVDTLANVSLDPIFQPWEVADQTRLVQLELAMAAQSPHVGIVEDLHKAAFRSTLGNSLYCLPHVVGRINPDQLRSHVSSHFHPDRMVLAGIGVNHDELLKLALASFGRTSTSFHGSDVASKYYGGEIRTETNSDLVHAALVSEGASFVGDDYFAVGVLQRVLGVTPFIKWGSNTASSRVNKAASDAAGGSPAMASGFNAAHSDSGLFGLYVVCYAENAGKVIKAAVGEFASAAMGNISEEEVTRAKNQFKANILMDNEDSSSLLFDIGTQVILRKSYTNAQAAADAVDKVTKDQVIKVAKRIFNGKPTFVARGKLHQTPYLDELR